MKKHSRLILKIVIIIFAIIGFTFTSVFFAMQFNLLNVKGTISERNKFFKDNSLDSRNSTNSTTNQNNNLGQDTKKDEADYSCLDKSAKTCSWNETREWEVVKGGLIKDADLINKVAKEADVSPRLLASIVVPEQTRFFTAEREVFKRYFEPLKILGSLSKFSLGVSGIKQDTAILIEKYASDKTSPFYPGDGYSEMIQYKDASNHDNELYNRLSDAKNHYYAYLYTAIFIKEIESQWKNSGFNIEKEPGAIITLFNLGFSKSLPKEKPGLGGAPIETGGLSYSYGELGLMFYNSNELSDIFKK